MADMVVKHGKATITVQGLGELYRKFKQIVPDAQNEAIGVLNDAVERVYQKSQALVPVDAEDGGQLKASGRKSKARVNKKTLVVTASVAYGGNKLRKLAPQDSPIYAIVQHEDLSFKHDHGQAKYLEQPFVEEKGRVLDELQRRILTRVSRG